MGSCPGAVGGDRGSAYVSWVSVMGVWGPEGELAEEMTSNPYLEGHGGIP